MMMSRYRKGWMLGSVMPWQLYMCVMKVANLRKYQLKWFLVNVGCKTFQMAYECKQK